MSPCNRELDTPQTFPLPPTKALPTALHPEPRQHQHLGRSEERHGSEAKTFLHGHVQLGLSCCLCHIGSGYALSWVRLVTDAGCTLQCPRLWCLHGRQDCLGELIYAMEPAVALWKGSARTHKAWLLSPALPQPSGVMLGKEHTSPVPLPGEMMLP